MVNGLIALLLLAGLQTPAGTGAIDGTVTIDGSATPIPNINVTLTAVGGGRTEIRTATDESGRFSFKNLFPGPYYLTTAAKDYVRPYKSASTKSVTVTEGSPPANGDLTLTPTGAIKGSVRRRDGTPVANAGVLAIPITYVGNQAWLGASSTYSAPGGSTNAQGEYEILFVDPMEYYIVAGQRGANWRPDGTYYPNAIHPSNASSIIVFSGATVTADIEWQDVPRYKVSGKVVPELPPGEATRLTALYLVHKDTRVRDDVPPNDITSPSRISSGVFEPDTNLPATIQNGLQFEIRNVRPGSYDLIAVMSSESSSGYRGYASMEVFDRDIENASVVVRPGVTVIGNAQFFLRAIGTTPHLGNSVWFADYSGGTTYSLRNVPPGTFAVTVDGAPVSDVLQNGQSIFDSGLVVGTSAPAPLEIVVSRSPGAVRGVVRSADPRAAQYAWLSVVPSAPSRDNLNLYRSVRADAQGRFGIAGIVPGQYKLFTFDEVPYFAGTNPKFISRYESSGIPIIITEGQTLSIDPTVIPIQ